MRKIMTAILGMTLTLLTGCGVGGQIMDGDGMLNSYRQITQEEAREMMQKDDGHLIVDVRRQDEYDAGHIPGAICVPNESIGDTPPAALPDREQILLVYCRSGRRSKEAAQKLFDLGYAKVYEFGGILDWTGEIIAKPTPTVIAEVDGRQFTVTMEDNSSAAALIEKLSEAPLELELRDYGGFEKVGALPWSLPTNDARITTKPGDLILYQGNQITVYYGENTWSLTKLGALNFASEAELLESLGDGGVTARFFVEWSE